MSENLPKITGYEILGKLGEGGMSVIYKAIQKSLERKVVIKVLHPHFSSDKNFVARLEREAKASGVLKHQNVVDVIDFANEGDLYYIVMEYIDGQTLKDLLEKQGKIPIEVASAIINDVCTGLYSAHSKGITHRDIKPGNIMIDKDGVVKVTDFGLALMEQMTSITTTGSLVGTPAYMSPEQTAGRKPDNRSDIFSTGVVMYEMLSGMNPFDGDSYSAVVTKIIMHKPAPISTLEPMVPKELENIIEKALEKDVEKRYQDIKFMIDDLQNFLEKSGHIRTTKLIKDYLENPADVSKKLKQDNINRRIEKGIYYMSLGLGRIDNAIQEFDEILKIDPDNQKAKECFNELVRKKEQLKKSSIGKKSAKTREMPVIKPVIQDKEEKIASVQNVSNVQDISNAVQKEDNFPPKQEATTKIHSKLKFALLPIVVVGIIAILILSYFFVFGRNKSPIAIFEMKQDSDEVPVTVSYFDKSIDKDGKIVSYYWDFGDGNFSSEKNPTYTYGKEGTYTTKLQVTDNKGKKSIFASTQIKVLPPNQQPIANFEIDKSSNEAPVTVSFLSRSMDNDGKIDSLFWDFGDGTTSTELKPTHTYEKEGTYISKLQVKDNRGKKSNVFEVEIKVMPPSKVAQTKPVKIVTKPATTTTTKATTEEPKDAVSYRTRGWDYYEKGEYDKAISDFTKSIEMESNNAKTYNYRGLAYTSKGEYDKAIADFTKAIELDKKFAFAYNNRGWAYYNKGQYDEAISDYSKAIDIDSKYAFVYTRRGWAYEKKGLNDKAEKDFKKARELEGKK